MTRWKATERTNAAILGGERVPVTGRGRGSAPDIKHERYSIEVKDRATLPQWLHGAMDQAVKSVKATGQIPMVILHQKGMRHLDNFVVLRMRDVEQFLFDR